MPTAPNQVSSVHPLRSLFFQCSFMVAVCVMLVVAVIVGRNNAKFVENVETSIQQRADEKTNFLASQLGGAVKFGQEDVMRAFIDQVREISGRNSLGIAVFDEQGEEIFLSADLPQNVPLAQVTELKQSVLSNQSDHFSDDRMLIAKPILFGNEGTLAGVLVTTWTTSAALEAVQSQQQTTLALGLGVFIAALLGAALYFRLRLSVPLGQVRSAMSAVAGKDLDVKVPQQARRDEIGVMARELEVLRQSLAQAKAAEVETTFKSAAIEATSSAIMILDEEAQVIFANPACAQLLEQMGPDLYALWPGVDMDDLTGANLSHISELAPLVHQTLAASQSGAEGVAQRSVILRIGWARLEVTVGPVRGDDGTVTGCVIEWADRTKSHHDTALIAALNEDQLRIEFDVDGQLSDANQTALALAATR